MRDVTGHGCGFGEPPLREDLPLHDITGGSTWLPGLLPALYPEVEAEPILAGIERARYMLRNAADLGAVQDEDQFVVTVTNNTGHKLPTGYPEGRRIWINVRFLDGEGSLVGESGAYDATTGVLTRDAGVTIYEVHPGMDETVAAAAGLEPGPSFHFVLNNVIFSDNRIPPRGFANATYDAFGGAPVGHAYADGQFWDDSTYAIPPGAALAEVRLYYQSTSKEFIEFLRDENTTNGLGQMLYDLWDRNGKCPPELMAAVTVPITGVCPADIDGSGAVDFGDILAILSAWGDCPDCPEDLSGNGSVDFADVLVVLGAWGACP